MNCVIEGNCVKAFGKAIHALSRIGDELWLDPMVKGEYNFGSASKHGKETIKCKLLMKSVLPLFRCLTSIERSVERCRISVSTATDRVVIQFFCRHGIIKTHNMHFQESEALQAVFASHLCPNVLRAPARLLADMVMHFPPFQEEITLSITAMKVTLRNYQEGGKGHMKTLCTEMSLHPDEFDYFQIGLDSDITFCLKELRGILSFAEYHSLPVSIYLGAAGKPVCFSVDDMVLEGTVLLATLMDSESNDHSQPTEPRSPTTPRGVNSSAQPVDAFEGPSSMHHDIPAEMVASSQGSPVINSPDRMHQNMWPACLSLPGSTCTSANTSPASTKICSLLFKAVSSKQDDGACAAQPPVLACYSDEENTDDNQPGSPSL